jgi:hypothetical protein
MARITGKNGALYLFLSGSWTAVGDLYDWDLNYEMVTLDGSIKGDGAERLAVSHGQGRLSAKRFVQGALTFVFADLITAGARLDWALVTIDTGVANFSTNPNAKIQGTGYLVRSQTRDPRGMAEDNMEIQCDTTPVFS